MNSNHITHIDPLGTETVTRMGSRRTVSDTAKAFNSGCYGLAELVKRDSFRIPNITCRSWCIANADSGEFLLWSRPTERLQVKSAGVTYMVSVFARCLLYPMRCLQVTLFIQPASITKVVTALVIIELAEKMREPVQVDFFRRKCTVSTLAASFASWTAEHGWNNGQSPFPCLVISTTPS